MVEQVRPGGWLVFDHYTPSLRYLTKVPVLALRPVLKRAPIYYNYRPSSSYTVPLRTT